MRRLPVALFTFFVCVFIPAAYAKAQEAYTLQQCIDYALENNEMVQNAELEQYLAEAQVGQTRAQGLPQINGSAEAFHFYMVPKQFIPAQFFDPNAAADTYVPVQFQTSYIGQASINLEQILFDGSYFVGLKAAKTFKELATKAKKRTEIEVVSAVSKAYYLILVNEERLGLIGQNYRRLDTLLYETKVMYENGFAEKIDVYRVQVSFNNIKVEQENTQRLIDLSYYMLKFQMGMPVDEPIALADEINEVEVETVGDVPTTFDYGQRIEYAELKTNQMLAELNLRNTRIGYAPKLSFLANIGANAGSNDGADLYAFDERWFGSGFVGLRLNVPIFDGLLKQKTIQENRVQLRQIDNQFDRLENSIDLEIRQSQVNLTNAISVKESRRENMELAKEVFRVAKIKYQEGVGSNLEVTEAESDYKEAETNYYSALYDALVAKVDYKRATGQLY